MLDTRCSFWLAPRYLLNVISIQADGNVPAICVFGGYVNRASVHTLHMFSGLTREAKEAEAPI